MTRSLKHRVKRVDKCCFMLRFADNNQKVHLLLDLHEVGGRDAPINHLRGRRHKVQSFAAMML